MELEDLGHKPGRAFGCQLSMPSPLALIQILAGLVNIPEVWSENDHLCQCKMSIQDSILYTTVGSNLAW